MKRTWTWFDRIQTISEMILPPRRVVYPSRRQALGIAGYYKRHLTNLLWFVKTFNAPICLKWSRCMFCSYPCRRGLTNLPSYINVQLIRRSSPGGQRSISNSFITSRQVRASHLDVFQLITKKEIFLRSCSFPKEKFPPKKTDSDIRTNLL